jgi:hypothetical protein
MNRYLRSINLLGRNGSAACLVVAIVLYCAPSRSSEADFKTDAGPPKPSEKAMAMTPGRIDEITPERKIDYLNHAFEDMHGSALAWTASWAMISQGLFAYQLIEAIRGTETWMCSPTSNTVGAIQAQLSFVLALVFPFKPMTARRQFRHIRASGAGDNKSTVSQGERLLRAAAADVRFMNSWVWYLINAGVNVLGGVIIVSIEGRRGLHPALFNMGAGMALSFLNAWTTPTGAERHYREYTHRFGAMNTPKRAGRSLDLNFFATVNGGALVATF